MLSLYIPVEAFVANKVLAALVFTSNTYTYF